MKKVMIAAGGTGGHIYPGLALAEVLIEKNPGLEVVFIGSSSRMEATLIPSAGYRFIGIEVKSTYGGLWNKVESAVSMIKEERECADILQKEKPDAVVGFGNYISVPVITAAHRLHIPTMISEQNSFMGKANRYLVRYADAVEAAYPSSIEGIAKARCLGN
ncbi:MAG TPA: undecaprenyldiphospho-muramoylpentapeptide beta-N-acetylglucosaminyltransferase, partial [Erysipelotrichaceae bacterium]|nr:undecaprenyldiphospho-muramoylpentapeptide beta-N-acetylglucosaminyltransferase [Erysipelotrichaceae bacterium]